MKKVISFLIVVMAAACVFAAGAKWKSADIYNEKKFNKLIETYNLTKTYEKDNVELYKNEETSDWIYILREGSEENLDKRTYFISFASLDGVFDSCTIYGGFTSHSQNVKYMYSYINESNSAIQKGDYKGKSTYGWNNPQYIFYIMFKRRLTAFMSMDALAETVGISIPEDVRERYVYFGNWIVDNNKVEKIETHLPTEYKKYLKEHK